MKKIFLILVLFPFSMISQVAVYGNLWEKGTESACNWYFSGDLACMEILPNNPELNVTSVRLIMNSNTNELTIVTNTTKGSNYIITSADSIVGQTNTSVEFNSSNITKEFDQIGACRKYQWKTHENEYMAFLFENSEIELSKFKKFIKNDLIFNWIAYNKANSFPAQAITVSATGELERSFQTVSISSEFDKSVFEIPSGALKIE